jgi:hypothetical protein
MKSTTVRSIACGIAARSTITFYSDLLVSLEIGIKENKTPGGEHCLDPPGAELLAWPKISQATRAGT